MIDSVSDEGAAAAADLKRGRRRKPPIAGAGKLDRLPPHAPEAEQGVLGCVLLSPNECMGECIGRFKEGAEVFYDLRHQTIYGALAEMYDKREAIDVITLQHRLKDKQLLEEVGGIAYLASLPDSVPSAANLGYYLDIVKEKAYSKGEKAAVRCYGADDVREGVAIMHQEGVDVAITGNSTNPTRFQHPVMGVYKKERLLEGKKFFSVASGGGAGYGEIGYAGCGHYGTDYFPSYGVDGSGTSGGAGADDHHQPLLAEP